MRRRTAVFTGAAFALAFLTAGCAAGQQPSGLTAGTTVAPGTQVGGDPAKPITVNTPGGQIQSWCIADNIRAFAQNGRIVSVVNTYHASNGPFDCNQNTN